MHETAAETQETVAAKRAGKERSKETGDQSGCGREENGHSSKEAARNGDNEDKDSSEAHQGGNEGEEAAAEGGNAEVVCANGAIENQVEKGDQR